MIKQSNKASDKSSTKLKVKQSETVDEPLPLKHVAIIMDGNRRWADRKHVPRLWGHKEGVQTLKKLVKYAAKRGLEYLTVYAFSSENWQRDQEEVDYLFELFARVLTDELQELHRANVRLRFIGKLDDMPSNLQQKFSDAVELTGKNTGLNMQVALNYGSRVEITEAFKTIAEKVAKGQIKPSDITPDMVSEHLYTKELPDPDLIIRTGGEMRLSNYLLWQAAYTELYVTNTMWPEFNDQEFDKAIKEFSNRQRRYGM
ncbi:MAG: isoprenyl transferase [Candidatus Obscuribacterales bacterium]|nr:isoprenyl transferase [Candidatus Obscuribacterales bacterium]